MPINTDMKEYLTLDNVKEILQNIDGECVPIVFIDHIDIFYNDGRVRTVDGAKIRQLFPKVKSTTMGILNDNKDINEINVKVDMHKIYTYLNELCQDVNVCVYRHTQRALQDDNQ